MGNKERAVSSGTGLGKGMTAWHGGGRKVRDSWGVRSMPWMGLGRCGPLGEAALRNERDKVSRHPRKDC